MSNPALYVLDDDKLDYIDQVFDRSRKLIQAEIWQGVKKQRLESWIGCLGNYQSELLGAYLLDNLCFRSKDQFNAMLDVLFVNAMVTINTNTKVKFLELIQKRPPHSKANDICLAPVIDFSSPPTKSGPYILRLAQRRYGIRSDWLAWPNQLIENTNLKHLYFIDDFCGTGIQFTEFANRIDLASIYQRDEKLQITYLVGTIHETGIEKIKEEFPYIEIKSAERLKKIHSILSDESFERYKISGFKELILHQYENIITMTNLPKKGNLASGFGDLGLAYAFSHATPNNTLPIFWYETNCWTPLLDR